MPGEPFKGKTNPEGKVSTVERPGVSTEKEKETFAQEMHFQVYRIENVLSIKDPEALKGIVATNPDLMKQPALMNFFSAYSAKRTNEFIEQAKTKTAEEREKLLDGIRKLVFKASLSKKEAERKLSDVGKKQAEEQDKEISKTQEMLTKELTMEDITSIESDLTMPLMMDKSKVDLNKVQHYYMKIIAGQRAFGTHMQSMQESYGGAIKKFESFNKKYTSGWRKYAGVVDWGGRKISSGWGYLKRGVNWVRGKKTTPEKSESEKVNEAIAKAREQFKEKMDRLKSIKTKIDSRSSELKKGIGNFKLDIRGKLKNLIASEDWTKAKLLQKENLKALLEKQKQQLGESLSGIREKGKEIDDARGKASTLKGNLATKYATIKSGETSLAERVEAVKKRVSQLETTYGKEDPRVLHVRQKVLVPLLQGQDRMAQVKEGTADKLSNVEEDNQRLDLLKADVFVGETNAVDQIAKLELQISTEGKKIDVLTAKRTELHQLLEGMETAYMAVDEFKSSVDTNLDKMLKENTKAAEAVDKQYDVLKNIKASEPGIGSSLYNTVGIGHYGVYGAAIELPLKYIPRATGYAGAWVLNKVGLVDEVSWKQTEKWHIGGLVEYAYKKYDGWLSRGGFKQHTKDSNWFVHGLSRIGNFPAGVLGAGLGLVNGVTSLVLETPKVLDSIGNMITDWGEVKKMLRSVVHWEDLKKGEFSLWAGRVGGDLAVIFFTAGSSAGASAAARAGQAGAGFAGKSMAYAWGYAKEVGRNAGVAVQNGGKFAFNVIRHPIDFGKAVVVGTVKTVADVAIKSYHVVTGAFTGSGLRKYFSHVAQSLSKEGGKLDDLARSADDIVKGGFDMNLVKNPELKSLLEKAKNEGVKSLTREQLLDISTGLRNEMYLPGTKLGARTKIEALAKRVDGFARVKIKHEVISEMLATKYGVRDVNAVLAQKPSSVLEARRIKRDAKNNLDDLLDQRDALMREMQAAKFRGDPASSIASKQGFLDNCEQHIASMQQKIAQLSTFEMTKMALGTAVKFASNAKEFVIEMAKKAKGLPAAVRNNPRVLWDNPVVAVGTWPVWASVKYLKRFFEGKSPAAASSQGMFTEMANIRAVSDMSAEINRLLKAGQLKEAVTLYQAVRVGAKEIGMPIAAMDKSFLGFLHKVVPGTAMYMGRVNDLSDAQFIEKLPSDAKVDTGAMGKYEKEAAAALVGLIKAKPRQ